MAAAVTHLGKKIEDKCPCGKTVGLNERQELVFDDKNDVWMRCCEQCIKKGGYFK